MHVAIKTVDIGPIKAIIMVATNEYLVTIWQIAEPIKEIQCFPLFSDHAEISGMDHDIGLGQIPKAMMRSMGIREM